MSPRLGEVVPASESDERLVKLASTGHERAFAVIVERYRPELSAFAGRLSADGNGEDIVQQAFLSAFAALRAGADVKHLRGWLYRIVRNAAARSRAPLCMPLDGGAASGESVEEVVQQRALAMDALAEVARLPKRQRQAIVGTALDGRGRAEVASSMGVSEGAVRQLVHRARSRIRTAVTAVTPWPLVRWVAAAGPGGGGPANVTAGVGGAGASSVGVALKLGIVLASGAIVTGVAAVDVHRGARPHRADARAGSREIDSPAARRGDVVLAVAVVAPAPAPVDRSQASPTGHAVAVAFDRVRVRRRRDDAAAQPDRHRQGGGVGPDRGLDRGTGSGSGHGHPGSSQDGGSDQGPAGYVSGLQAVVASDGGSARGSDRSAGSSPGSSGPGSGSGWGAGSGRSAGSG